MTMLVWGCDLEQEATNYVRGCPTAASGTTTYGENFHRVSSANLQYYRDGVKDAVVAWWKVYRSYPVPRQMYMGASHGMVSSYSQVGKNVVYHSSDSVCEVVQMKTLQMWYR
ncbi:hypothetical protein OESDEN_06465 [Oesophagostomum dentatum]|uniref:SCP domain-containing protein n=1 Tax=Oesophagostomum dentatum TaxID=61180 RepID=A0A0B1TCS1_OESDE|nr:hypothetical protein OESDEN_06465 [Oesophagostomum dentatum]